MPQRRAISLIELFVIVALVAGTIRLSMIARNAYLDVNYPHRIVKFDAAGRSYLVRANWKEWLADYKATMATRPIARPQQPAKSTVASSTQAGPSGPE